MNTPPRPIRILGIDPGLRHCGWGVIDQQGNALHFVAAGVIHPPAQEAITARLRYLHDGLQQVIHTYQPQEIALKKVSFLSMASPPSSWGRRAGRFSLVSRSLGCHSRNTLQGW